MTPKSLKGYMRWPSLWTTLGRTKFLPYPMMTAKRFASLFGAHKVQTMPNIKFDRLNTTIKQTDNPLKAFIPESTPFLVLGSVRQPEENQVESIIQKVQSSVPETVIGCSRATCTVFNIGHRHLTG